MKKTLIILAGILLCKICEGQVLSGEISSPVLGNIPVSISVDSVLINAFNNSKVRSLGWAKKIFQTDSLRMAGKSDFYIENDSVFIVNYFYGKDTTSYYRAGGGFVGMKNKFLKYFESDVDPVFVNFGNQ